MNLINAILIATSVIAHNWIFGDSRAPMASQLQPVPPRNGPRLPHRQVGAGQDFVIEWATGHGGRDYYFVVVKATDESRLKEHRQPVLDAYLAQAPESAYIYEDVRYERTHASYYNGNNDGSQYERRLDETDPQWMDRSEFHRDLPQWKYSESDLRRDQRVAYFNPDYPWIEAVHKFAINPPYWANERDSARFSIPARGGSGEYVVQMIWAGYRDAVDVDVLPELANDIYGRPKETKKWVKSNHCLYPNINDHQYSRCIYRQAGSNSADALERCQRDGERRCNAVNCVPLYPPESVKHNGWESPLGAHVPWTDPEADDSNRCDPERIPADADENTYVCYGFVSGIPEDPAFNPDTEDHWYIRDEDPEDPVFWSQCFRLIQERIFEGNVPCPECEGQPAEVVQRWKVGHQCRTCDDLDTFDDSPTGYKNGNHRDVEYSIPRWTIHKWELSETCRRCF